MNSIFKLDNFISQGPYRMTLRYLGVVPSSCRQYGLLQLINIVRRQEDGTLKPFKRHSGGVCHE